MDDMISETIGLVSKEEISSPPVKDERSYSSNKAPNSSLLTKKQASEVETKTLFPTYFKSIASLIDT